MSSFIKARCLKSNGGLIPSECFFHGREPVRYCQDHGYDYCSSCFTGCRACSPGAWTSGYEKRIRSPEKRPVKMNRTRAARTQEEPEMKTPLTYIPRFLDYPDFIFKELQGLDWEQRDAPRQEYYCNDYPEAYTYGKGRGERIYQPKPYTEAITLIRKQLEWMTESKFEVCFLNRYMDQSQHLGWHADDSPEMDDGRPIGIVSLGVERDIWFRSLAEPKEIEKLTLGNGSLCLMSPGMQDTHQHRIPKAGFTCGERISLTFRGYVSAAKDPT